MRVLKAALVRLVAWRVLVEELSSTPGHHVSVDGLLAPSLSLPSDMFPSLSAIHFTTKGPRFAKGASRLTRTNRFSYLDAAV